MYPTTRTGTFRICLAIGKAMMGRRTLGSASSFVAEELGKMGWMDRDSRAQVRDAAMQLARKCLLYDSDKVPQIVAYGMDDVMKAFNRAYKRTWVRTKRTGVESRMKLMRGKREPVVFYLVSSHQKPQEAHKDLQGKLLVDYFWKSTLEKAGVNTDTVGRVIKNRRIRTVQWAMGEPHYLITRPNCRHYLIPVKTSYVLSHSIEDVRRLEQKKETGVRRPLTDHKRWEEYLELRGTVLRALQKKLGMAAKLGM